MSKQSEVEQRAELEATLDSMLALQADATSKRKAVIRAEERLAGAKQKLADAEKAESDFSSKYKEAQRLLMTMMTPDVMAQTLKFMGRKAKS